MSRRFSPQRFAVVDNSPRVSADWLRHAGVFKQDARTIISIDGETYLFAFVASRNILCIEHARSRAKSYIRVAFRELTFGSRVFFVEDGRKLRSFIYMSDGFWLPRRASERASLDSYDLMDRHFARAQRLEQRLFGTHTLAPATGARKQKLIDELLATIPIEDLSPGTQSLIHDHRPARPARVVPARDRLARADDMRTSAAVLRQSTKEYISRPTSTASWITRCRERMSQA
jgi:hypothetical protein